MSYFHFVKRGILGIRMFHGFTLDWVQVGSIACLEVGPQRGFARETLGEPSNFQVVANRSQQRSLICHCKDYSYLTIDHDTEFISSAVTNDFYSTSKPSPEEHNFSHIKLHLYKLDLIILKHCSTQTKHCAYLLLSSVRLCNVLFVA